MCLGRKSCYHPYLQKNSIDKMWTHFNRAAVKTLFFYIYSTRLISWKCNQSRKSEKKWWLRCPSSEWCWRSQFSSQMSAPRAFSIPRLKMLPLLQWYISLIKYWCSDDKCWYCYWFQHLDMPGYLPLQHHPVVQCPHQHFKRFKFLSRTSYIIGHPI